MFGENGGFGSACATCAVLLIMTSRASLDKYSLVLSVQTPPIEENIIRIIDYQPRSIGLMFNFYDLGTKFMYQICADVLKAPYKMCTLCKTSINFNIWQCTPFYGAHPIQCTLQLLFMGHTLYNSTMYLKTSFYGTHPIQCTLKLLFMGHTLYNVP